MLFGSFDELPVFRDLATPENRPISMLQGPFGCERVILVMLNRLSAPRERPSKFPVRRQLTSIEEARRPALLVHTRLQLLWILEMAPAALERELASRVP